MIKVTITGPEEHRWKMKTSVPGACSDPQKVEKLSANGMELETIKRDLKNLKIAEGPAFDTQTWYGDDARFIWKHFKTYYQ